MASPSGRINVALTCNLPTANFHVLDRVRELLEAAGAHDVEVRRAAVGAELLEIGLPPSLVDALVRLHITTVDELCGRSEANLIGERLDSMSWLYQIKTRLAEIGRSLRA